MDHDVNGPSMPNAGSRDQPFVEFTVSSPWHTDLANFQCRLLAEIRELLRLQQDALVLKLRGTERDTDLHVTAPLAINNTSEDPQLEPSRISVISCPDTTGGPESKLGEEMGTNGSFVHVSSPELDSDSLQEEDDIGVKLQVDGAFSSIFAASALEYDRPHYHVENLYKTVGLSQSIARSELFINFTLIIIALNAIYIGVESDWNDANTLYEADTFFVMSENFFCLYFVIEWLIRFMAFQRKRDSISDGWFRFDTVLVLFAILETWILAPVMTILYQGTVSVPVGPLRLLRLMRLTRIARLMRFLPELVTMTKGMMRASRAVCSSLVMVAIMTYAFAIILTTVLKEDDAINELLAPRNFKTISSTMFTLLVNGTFLDPGDVMQELFFSQRFMPLLGCCILLLFILFSAVTVMNMLIGILCEVVNAVGQSEKDDAALLVLKQSLLKHLMRFDNGDGLVSREELMMVMNDKRSKAVLKGMRIDRLFLLELQSMLFPHAAN